jgi:hypothetical protein
LSRIRGAAQGAQKIYFTLGRGTMLGPALAALQQAAYLALHDVDE